MKKYLTTFFTGLVLALGLIVVSPTTARADWEFFAFPISYEVAVLPTVTLSASPTNVAYSGASTLTWSSTGATSCTATNGWSGAKATSGSQSTGALTATTTFTITCTGAGGTSNPASATVTVAAPGGPATPTGFTASPSTCGNNWLNLSWNAVSGATSYTVMEGSRTVYSGSSTAMSDTGLTPGSTHTYTLSASNSNGTSSTTSTTGTVVTACPGVPTATISVSPTTVASGESTAIIWSSTNATSCTAGGSWSGTKTTSGSGGSGALYTTTTYTLTCVGPGGTSPEASATVTVNPVGGPTATIYSEQGNSVPYNSSTILWWSTSNVTSCTANDVDVSWVGNKSTAGGGQTIAPITETKTYSISCTGPSGPAYAEVTVVVTGAPASTPTVSITANPTSVTSGSSSQLSWSSANTTSCTASNGWSGAKATSGTVLTGGLYSSTTYALSCTGSGGTAVSSATVTVTAAPEYDVCNNIAGMQTSAPSGMHEGGDGNCYYDGDYCYNIEGTQYSVPEGMTWDGVSTCRPTSDANKPWWKEF